MNKSSLCLLVLLFSLVYLSTPVSCASPLVSLAHTVSASLLDWITNQADWFQTVRTANYCFSLGWYNVLTFNDGGLAFYTCLDSYFKTIRFL